VRGALNSAELLGAHVQPLPYCRGDPSAEEEAGALEPSAAPRGYGHGRGEGLEGRVPPGYYPPLVVVALKEPVGAAARCLARRQPDNQIVCNGEAQDR
jgi:hypothetical protein